MEEERKRAGRYVKFDVQVYLDLDGLIQSKLVEKGVALSGEALSDLIRQEFKQLQVTP